MTSIIPGSSTSERIFQGQRKDFIVMRKDTFSYTGTYSYVHTDGTTVQYDFTDCVGMMHIKKKKTDTVPVKVIGISFDEYEYTLQADSDDMDINAGKYFYDLQIYDADHTMVTKLYGSFIVLQDVTDFDAVIELEYYTRFKNEIENEIMPKEKITVLLSSSILNEILAYVKYDYSVIFDSSISAYTTLNIIFNTKFGSLLSISRELTQTNNVIFNSIITITTYKDYNYTTLLTSKITLTKYSSSFSGS